MTMRGSADTANQPEHLPQSPRAKLQQLELPQRDLAGITLLVTDIDLEDVVTARLCGNGEKQRWRERAVRHAVARAGKNASPEKLVGRIRILKTDAEQHVDRTPNQPREIETQHRIVAAAPHTEHCITASHDLRPCRREVVEGNLSIAID